MTERKSFAVKNCARCGEDHPDGVEFKQFLRPVVDEDGTVWDWWGECPISGDPILLRKDDEVIP